MFKTMKENINLMLSTEFPAGKAFVINGFLENEINKLELKIIDEIQKKNNECEELRKKIKELTAEIDFKNKKSELLQDKEQKM